MGHFSPAKAGHSVEQPKNGAMALHAAGCNLMRFSARSRQLGASLTPLMPFDFSP
ncbi:hypothetical protein [Pseudoalteromonas rubra]|uniref:hypothetical protein n=1 Tax=Pseudoalteromonas rubra TaxID=43658 RepID=UPI000A60C08F|nr:hypothetical protein [Pseudoalteromonas rubra]